jgi:hypothetical protein
VQASKAAFTKNGIKTTSDSVFLSGTTNPGAKIVIYNNIKMVAEMTAAPSGSWGVSVPLSMGVNKIKIEVTFKGKTTSETLTYIRTAYLAHPSNDAAWTILVTLAAILLIGGILSYIFSRKFLKEKPNEVG